MHASLHEQNLRVAIFVASKQEQWAACAQLRNRCSTFVAFGKIGELVSFIKRNPSSVNVGLIVYRGWSSPFIEEKAEAVLAAADSDASDLFLFGSYYRDSLRVYFDERTHKKLTAEEVFFRPMNHETGSFEGTYLSYPWVLVLNHALAVRKYSKERLYQQ